MRAVEFAAETLATLLRKQKVATLPELMEALGSAKRTVFRRLRELPYLSSYSHRGAYYTLEDVAQFDEQGLWSYEDVWFSIHGTLLSSAVAFVETAEQGHYVEELDHELHIGTKDALRKLVRDARLSRERLGGQFLYCSADTRRRREQVMARRAGLAEPGVAGPLPQIAVLPDELRAAIVLFFSLLDEKQRRLYAGLEALKTGRGGDVRIAELLGLDVGTVARGRRELTTGEVEIGRVRAVGGGRKSTEKKRPT